MKYLNTYNKFNENVSNLDISLVCRQLNHMSYMF